MSFSNKRVGMTMIESSSIPCFTIDASVAVKWHVRDEDDAAAADSLPRDFINGRIRLVAPDHIRYEVPSAILAAVRRNRLTVANGQTAIIDFLAW